MLFTVRTDGHRVRWDVSSGGSVFGSTVGRPYKGGGMSGVSGAWEVKDDGAVCMKWRDFPTDCNYFFWDGHKLKFTYAPNANAAAIGAITVEFER
ncbi:hypothetical protein [Variovorax rhizosphaerae]|uniref:Uncharacterized protein n=1 Tax=Variovorax rhizosphaerae TaxID=1836200 RepID=A0ABU8WZF8_9BURK